MQQAKLPVDFVWCSYEAATCWAVIAIDIVKLAALKTHASDFAAQIAQVVFNSHAGYIIPKLILVSNDIDFSDINQVVWALATRSHPARDHFIFPAIKEFPMVPYLNHEDKILGCGGKAIINCLLAEQYDGKMHATTACFQHSYPKSIKNKVLTNWKNYGFR
ncbi:hypothetical protein [Arsenophonus apicola]|uniref:hypothetical protein n=1 Tax=Arsenophonus apicola TaxID=2879119 RepID=UPI00387A2E80